MAVEQRYTAFEKAKNYTKEYELDKVDSIVTKQEDGYLGYISAGQFATTGSNIFEGGQIIDGNLTIAGDIFANTFNVTTTSIEHFTASTNFGIDNGDTHTFTGSVKITGSLDVIGATTTLGNTIMTGSFLVSGSTTQYGNNTLIGNTTLSGSIMISGSITGSLQVDGDINLSSPHNFYRWGNRLFNYGQFIDTTTQSGSANTAYSMKLNTTEFSNGVSLVNGSRIQPQYTGVYNIQFSAQLSNTTNDNIGYDIWLAYTGSNVSNSNTQVDIPKLAAGQLGKAVAAWNWMIPIQANDYVELKWSCNASTGEIFATGSQSNPTRPAIPSVICTVTQIG